VNNVSSATEVEDMRWANASETELVGLVKLGNKRAFEQLVHRTKDICLNVAAGMLGSREDARDEVQNAMWLAYSRIELFSYESKFSTWVIRIVINRCLMRLRLARNNPVLPDQVETEDGSWYSCEAVTRDTPENELSRREICTHLRHELCRLPPLLRVPLEMHYIHERPVIEVARELKLTVAATKSRLHRAHLYLRARMMKHAERRGTAGLLARY
jgi:RNA polymerase sigma-70 factor, ECF subfamily